MKGCSTAIKAGRKSGRKSDAVEEACLDAVIMDTTALDKEHRAAHGHPAPRSAPAQLGALARQAGRELRQSLARLAPGGRHRSSVTPMKNRAGACARR
jgi:hypothetical protein